MTNKSEESEFPKTNLMNLNKRRDDLQCWRSVAIIGVLLFHIWPNCFPNGYLGVDIFFVLSGFLMATIVHKSSRVDFQAAVDFYHRRIKRIVPIYLVFILITVICISRVLWLEEYLTAQTDSQWAVGFLTNIQSYITKLDYFDMESQHRFFRHCWSLSVEMQFYLLVPILFSLWMNFFPKHKFSLIISCFLLSFIYNVYSTQYESTFSRIWQFMAGIAAQSYPVQKQYSKKSKYYFILCLFVVFLPFELNRFMASFIAIISSSILIASSQDGSDSPFKNALKIETFKKPLVFLGDVSYVLYLIHWPVVTYSRFIILEDDFGFFCELPYFPLQISSAICFKDFLLLKIKPLKVLKRNELVYSLF